MKRRSNVLKLRVLLLLCFLVNRMSSTRVTIFFELDLALNKLLILASPIIEVLTLLAGEFYKLIL